VRGSYDDYCLLLRLPYGNTTRAETCAADVIFPQCMLVQLVEPLMLALAPRFGRIQG